jgi:branched-chain amino acid transport system permease protein
MISDLVSPLVMGILLGGLYALIALGLSLVFGVMKLMNLAHGDFVVLSSFLAFALSSSFGFDPILSLLIIIPLFFGMGMLIQRYLLNRAFRISMEAPLIITIGISLIIQNSCQIIWSPASRALSSFYALKTFAIGPIDIPLVYLLDLFAALVTMLFLREFLRRTYLGRAITASSQHEKAALMVGIDTTRIYVFTFALATAIAAISGVFYGFTFSFAPSSGVNLLILAFGVVVMGGLGSMFGTFLAGVVFGLSQTLGGYFWGATAQWLVTFVIVLIILAVRPRGIFAR